MISISFRVETMKNFRIEVFCLHFFKQNLHQFVNFVYFTEKKPTLDYHETQQFKLSYRNISVLRL